MSRLLKFALPTFLLATIFIALRRPDQIWMPEVWNEDGSFVIPQILQHGIRAVFEPVNGYLIIPSRLISWAALTISPAYYPEISTFLGVIAQAGCVAVVAAAPTMLRNRLACALMLLVLPMNPEVYVLPQYTFWWTTIFLFLALIWQPARSQAVRNMLIVIGGFSSPMGIALLPLFIARTAVTRSKEDIVASLTATLVAAVQLYFVLVGDPAQTNRIHVKDIAAALARFFADWTVFGQMPYAALFGAAIAGFLAAGALALPRQERGFYVLIGLALGAALMSSMLRIDIKIASPIGDGPRYFFLPLVLIAWMLVWQLSSGHKLSVVASAAILIAATPVSFTYFQRGQDHLRPWSEAFRECIDHGALMPVHHDGNRSLSHQVPYDAALCRSAS